MNELKTFRVITAFASAATLTAIFVVGSTIGGELIPPFKNWLAGTFSHHWVGKGVLAVLLFLAFSLITFTFFRSAGEHTAVRAFMTLFWAVLLGTAAVFVFFLFESFAH